MNDELLALDETGLDAAVRECARITAPEITNDEYERIKADNSPRYQNTRTEMARAIRAYLRAAKPALSSIVTCCVTGAIPGDGGACGDCDPCLLGEASVPAPVKTLIAEKNSLIHRVGELEDELDSLRRLASSDSGVKVKPLVWRDHRPDSFPEPAWSAQTSFGFYNIEEVSASDSPAYVVRLHAHHFVADKDSLDDAKAAAQADYEARIRSALVEVPAVKGEPEPVAWRDIIKQPDERPLPTYGQIPWAQLGRDVNDATFGRRADFEFSDKVYPGHQMVLGINFNSLARIVDKYRYYGLPCAAKPYAAPPADAWMREAFVRALASLAAAISILERTPKAKKAVASDKIFDTMLDDYRKALEAGRQALTAPGATTKSDGGLTPNATTIAAIKELERGGGEIGAAYGEYTPITVRGSTPDLSSTRSEVTIESVAYQIRLALVEHYPAMNAVIRESVGDAAARALLDQFEIRRK